MHKWKLPKEKYTYYTSPREICTANSIGFNKLKHVRKDTIVPIMFRSYKIKSNNLWKKKWYRVYVFQRTNTILNDSMWIVYRPVISYRILNSCMNVMIAGDELQNPHLCSALTVFELEDIFNNSYLLWYGDWFHTV